MSNFNERFLVRPIPSEECREWFLYKHYAHRIVNVVFSFGLFDRGILVGVCSYGMPLNIECCTACGNEYIKKSLELNRVIKNDGLPFNIQSWFIAQTFRFLPKPFIIISYADPNNGHTGYTYQALNFLFTGVGGYPTEYIWKNTQITGRTINLKSWWIENHLPFDSNKTINENFLKAGGQIIPQTPKNRYILFLGNKHEKKKMRKLLKWNVLKYPKMENRKYDTSHKCTVQLSFFDI